MRFGKGSRRLALLPGSRGEGGNSVIGNLNKSYLSGWKNEAKLKL